jgi:hypothetical protein
MDFERDFLMNGFRKAIGNMPEAKLRFAAMGWYEKGFLLKSDLAVIHSLFAAKNAEATQITEPVEDR